MIPRESYRRVRPFESRASPLRPAGSFTRQLDWISSSAHERGPWTSLRLSDARDRPPQAGSGRPSPLIKQREPSARWQMNVPVFLTRPRVPGLHSLVHIPRRAHFAPFGRTTMTAHPTAAARSRRARSILRYVCARRSVAALRTAPPSSSSGPQHRRLRSAAAFGCAPTLISPY